MPTYPPAKPATPYRVPASPFAPSGSLVLPVSESALPLADLVSGSASTTNTDATYTDAPTPATDANFGRCLDLSGTSGELRLPLATPAAGTPLTLWAIFRPDSGASGVVISATDDANGACGLGLNSLELALWEYAWFPTGLTVTVGHWHALMLTLGGTGARTITGYLYDYDATTPAVQTGAAGPLGFDALYGGTGKAVVDYHQQSGFAVVGRLACAGVVPGYAASASDFNALVADNATAFRAKLAASPSTLVSGSTGQALTLAGNTGFYDSGANTPSFVVTPQSQTVDGAKDSQAVTGADAATLTVDAGTGGSLLVSDGRAEATVAVSSTPATGFSLTAPTPASGPAHAASGDFTLALTGGEVATAVTYDLSADDGGTITPSSVVLGGGVTSATFTYTPATAGSRTVTATMATNPDGFATTARTAGYTATSGTLVPGDLALTGETESSISVSLSAPSGGSGSYTVEFHRAEGLASFTPGPSTLDGSPAVGPTFPLAHTFSGLAYKRLHGMVAVVTDAASASATTGLLLGSTFPALSVGFGLISHSMGGGIGDYRSLVTDGEADLFAASAFSRYSGNGYKVSDYLPTGTYLPAALAQFATDFAGMSEIWVAVVLGTNDAKGGVSADQYEADLTTVCDAITAPGAILAGVSARVVLSTPPCLDVPAGGSAADLDRLLSYTAKHAAIAAANPRVLAGTGDSIAFFANRLDLLQDAIHPTSPAGYDLLRKLVADDVTRAIVSAGAAAAPAGGGTISDADKDDIAARVVAALGPVGVQGTVQAGTDASHFTATGPGLKAASGAYSSAPNTPQFVYFLPGSTLAGEKRKVQAHAYAGGVHSFALTDPLTAAPTAGDEFAVC